MKIGPRYKRARRLGADLFEKTQTQKYAIRSSGRSGKVPARGYGKSDFGTQLYEKQRARYLYGIGERQFARYVANAVAKRNVRNDEQLYATLESRLDNVLYRLGIAPTRSAARQFVSHGHFTVNGKRITIPSYSVEVGDIIRLRSGSATKFPFAEFSDKIRDTRFPPWLAFDKSKGETTVVAKPKLVRTDLPFNIAAILEFYGR